MLNSPYTGLRPVTSADLAATAPEVSGFELQTSVAAVRTLTLPDSDLKDSFYIVNRSNYPAVVALHANDAAIYGGALVNPGQVAEFVSDDAGNWYNLSGNVGSSLMRSVSLTAAQIFTLNSVPVTLIPAPGAGRVLIASGIQLQMTRTGTAFANGGALEFRYGSGGAKVSADIAAAVVTTGGAGVEYAHVAGIEAAITPLANTALVLIANGADFITGTGTAKIRVAYRIDDFN